MKCHALEGAVAGGACGLAILALGVPVLAPVALIVGLFAGIRKDNKDVREERRRIAQEPEESDSNEDEDDDDTASNYHRHITMSPEISAILQRINERPWQPNHQERITPQDFNFMPLRTANEDEDTPRFINNNNEGRRPRRNVDSTEEPSLRNEEYFRRHGRQHSVDE